MAGLVVLWFGLLAPLAVSERRTAYAIAADPITLVTLFRGVTPVVCLLAAVALLRPRLWPDHRGEWLAVAFPTVALASTLWSVAAIATLLKAGVLAAVYGLVIVLVRTWRALDEGVAAVTTVAQLLVVSSLVGAMVVPQSAFAHSYSGGGALRLRGLFPEIHSVPLGWMALVGLLGVVAGLGCWKWQWRPAARLILGVASLSALALSQTRAAWAGAVAIVLAYVTLRGSRRLLLALLSLVGVAALAAAVMVPNVIDTVTSLLTRGQNEQQILSLGGRLPMWERAIGLWSERPLTGYGYYAGHRYGPYADQFMTGPAHDQGIGKQAYIDGAYVETILDLGLLGLAPLAALAVSAFGNAISRIYAGRRDRVDIAGILILGGLLVDSILSYSWQTPSYQGALLLALALMLHRVDTVESSSTPAPAHPTG